ncbi:hypothetical protein OAU26_04015 [Mariniblastus sp.]|nr:hypothetical protein [Mariniblastus sp.]
MKILIASKIHPDTVAELRLTHDVMERINASENELCEIIADRDVLVFRSGVQINRTVLANAANLKLLIRAGSGLDNLDLPFATELGIDLVRIPEPGAQAVAELAFGLMLNLAREIRLVDNELRRGHWAKQQTTGYTLHKKTLGIVGAGNIGSRVGEMATAWGMQAVGCVQHADQADADHLQRCGIRLANLKEVVSSADFLTIHVPKTESTFNLINREVISWMKPDSFLVNLARGGVLDEKALYDALQSQEGPIGAALDVHEQEGGGAISPLAKLSNVILTPHIGATTVDTMREIGDRILATLNSPSNHCFAQPPKIGSPTVI